MKLVVKYLHHSGFLIETESCVIVIDYYKDSPDNYVHNICSIGTTKRLYFLASHFHQDHFTSAILDFNTELANVSYILSSEIRKKIKGLCKDKPITFVKSGDILSLQDFNLHIFGSTDVGVSFLIELSDGSIFHAGDLNNWHWKAESSPQEVKIAETNYLKEIRAIAQYTKRINIAMLPIDPRLGDDFALGAKQFITSIKTDTLIPMHFWGENKKANSFATIAEDAGTHFVPIHNDGDTFNFEIKI